LLTFYSSVFIVNVNVKSKV